MVNELINSFSGSLVEVIFGIFRTHWPILLLLVFVSILSRIVRLPSVKGRIGEELVGRMTLNKLDRKRYTAFHDLYLPRPDGKGTTQIDHVVVSPFGIFVIETKNMDGWIFGDERSRQWTQSIYGKKTRFQNPLHQNALHIHALAKFLGLPRGQFHNLVFFVGNAKLKTNLPPHVATGGFRSLIQGYQERCLPAETVLRVTQALSSVLSQTDKRRAKREHVARFALLCCFLSLASFR